MFDFTSLNKGETIFDFHLPDGAEFRKLQELNEGDTYQVLGLFISKSKDDDYADHPVAVTPDFYIDLPEYMTEVVSQIMDTDEAVKAINDGESGIKITSYVKKKGKGKGKTFKAVEWINWTK